MERILVLGTGAGTPLDCFNTCFILQNDNRNFLVDTGGGLQILRQIRDSGVKIDEIHDVFISHKHIDHLLGVFYILRNICHRMLGGKYIGKLNLYCSKEVRNIIDVFISQTFHPVHREQYNENVIFHELENNKKYNIIGYDIKVLDLYSNECELYGFSTQLNNEKILTFLVDAPCSSKMYDKIRNTDWILSEVFCLEADKDIFKPHEKNHSTVKDICEIAENLKIKNLVLWHIGDKRMENRKQKFEKEGKEFFTGNLYVPDDLDVINL